MSTESTTEHSQARSAAINHHKAISPSTRKTKSTRILILSDTHNTLLPIHHSSASLEDPIKPATLSKTPSLPHHDILIHTGDLTLLGLPSELISQHQTLTNASAAEMKLVVAGNHDIALDREYYLRRGWEMHGENVIGERGKEGDVVDEVLRLWRSGKQSKNGDEKHVDEIVKAEREKSQYNRPTYLEHEGMSTHVLKAKGVMINVYASAWQPEYCDWAFGYAREEDRFNEDVDAKQLIQADEDPRTGNPGSRKPQNPVPDFPNVDIMMTHGPPRGILDKTESGEPVGCDHLRRAVARAKPLLHCFGHIHEGRGCVRMNWKTGHLVKEAEQIVREEDGCEYSYINLTDSTGHSSRSIQRGDETVFVNASIMDVEYRPVNRPWIVDVDLPIA